MNYYCRLKLPINCNPELIKSSYRREILIWHPDKAYNHPDVLVEDLNQAFMLISEAFMVLQDDDDRNNYLDKLYSKKPIEEKEITYTDASDLFTRVFKRFVKTPVNTTTTVVIKENTAPTVAFIPTTAGSAAAGTTGSNAAQNVASEIVDEGLSNLPKNAAAGLSVYLIYI